MSELIAKGRWSSLYLASGVEEVARLLEARSPDAADEIRRRLGQCDLLVRADGRGAARPIAVGMVSGLSTELRHAFFSWTNLDDRPNPAAIEAAIICIDEMFVRFDLRHVRLDIVETAWPQLRAVARFARRDGDRRGAYWDGYRALDVVLFSLERDRWEREVRPRLNRFRERLRSAG